jgi:hypothetical protein
MYQKQNDRKVSRAIQYIFITIEDVWLLLIILAYYYDPDSKLRILLIICEWSASGSVVT